MMKRKKIYTILTIIIAIAVITIGFRISYKNVNKTQINSANLPWAVDDFTKTPQNSSYIGSRVWVLYIGSEGCPFCAAESWAIYSSLGNYGSWNGIIQSYSNSTSKYPDTPGISFNGTSLSSSVVHFTGYETYNSDWKPLEKLNNTDSSLFREYDPLGKLPFVLIDGIYLHIGSAINPGLLQKITPSEVLNDLSNGTVAGYMSAISSEAGNLSAVINIIRNHMEPALRLSINESFSSILRMVELKNSVL